MDDLFVAETAYENTVTWKHIMASLGCRSDGNNGMNPWESSMMYLSQDVHGTRESSCLELLSWISIVDDFWDKLMTP
eukprot:1082411-Ditylum_brightwellii.AAC.1